MTSKNLVIWSFVSKICNKNAIGLKFGKDENYVSTQFQIKVGHVKSSIWWRHHFFLKRNF